MPGRALTSSAQVTEHIGDDVVIRGVYTVQDLGGHTLKVDDGKGGWRSVKRIALVRLDDDEYVELGDRPDDELTDFDGEVVVVEGRLYLPAGTEDEEMAASDPLPTLTSIRRVERSKT
jgi:hypothetical protein